MSVRTVLAEIGQDRVTRTVLRVALAFIIATLPLIIWQAGVVQGRRESPPQRVPVTTVHCEGHGLDSWCVVDGVTASDGSEWLFDERPDGTMYPTYQTP